MAASIDLSHVREMYVRIRHRESFEDVAARLSLADLEYLLEGADPLKLTYVYDKESGPWGEEVRQWVGANIVANVARNAINAGYTLETLEDAIKLGSMIDGSISHDAWLDRLVRTPRQSNIFKPASLPL
jgi:hypothetical protein